MNNDLYLSNIETPFGKIIVGTVGSAVAIIRFADQNEDDSFVTTFLNESGLKSNWNKTAFHNKIEKQLNEFFCGKRTSFSFGIKAFGSDLQLSVWEEIYKTNLAETLTLKELAKRVGFLNLKAIERACIANPVSIVIPSHRVEGITEFKGAASRKRLLNRFEQFFSERLSIRIAA